jgi:PAS domain S-box-containing protein
MSNEDLAKAKSFIAAVDSEYTDGKEHREMLEWALNINSQELSEQNEKLVDSLEKNIKINNILESSRQHLKLIIDNIWEGLIVIGRDRKIIEINTKAVLVSGVSRKDILGKKYSRHLNFVSDNKNVWIEDFIEKTLCEEKEFSLNRNIVLVTKNREMPVFVTSSPLPHYSEHWTGCVVIFRDATKERELEKLKDKFLSVASHELRTPLTVIRGYISLFLKWKLWNLQDNQEWYLQKIFSNVENLINMVNDMLDMSKLEAKKMEFYYENIDITQIVEEEIEDMVELFKKKNIQVQSSLDKVSGISDKSKIQQVLRNLLSNAYKFSREGWNVFIELKKTLETTHFKLSVKDSGIWIKKGNLWKLFKKFSQVWHHLHKTEKWTGLWLAICKEIVNWMKGDITVESIYWKHTIFSVILPLENKDENVT